MSRGDGLMEAWAYNKRLQPISISVGTGGRPERVGDGPVLLPRPGVALRHE